MSLRRPTVATLAAAIASFALLPGLVTLPAAAASASTVVLALPPESSPNWFFPIESVPVATSLNLQVESLLYMPLIQIGSNDEPDYANSLASGVTVNQADTVFTIHLSGRYKWSNGKPVTVNDILYTWNLIKIASGTSSSLPWNYSSADVAGIPNNVQSFASTGPNTITVKLDHAMNPTEFIINGLAQIMPVPESVWNRYPTNPNAELKFIAAVANSPTQSEFQVVDGAYRVSSVEPNDKWVFQANPSFGGHKAEVKTVILQYETSSASEFLGLKDGAVNYGFLPPSLWNARTELTGDVVNPTYIWGFNYLLINLSSRAPGGIGQIFQQLPVRQALQMGVDQTQIIRAFFHGNAVPENGPIPSEPRTPYYDAALAKADYPFNPAAGKRLLEKNGWHLVDGVMTKDGHKLAFTYTYAAGSTTWSAIAQLLKSDWAQEGIDATLSVQPYDTVVAEGVPTDPTKWQMLSWQGGLFIGWTYDPNYFPTSGGLFNTNGIYNAGNYSNATMDKLAAAVDVPGTPAQTLSRLYAYEAFAARDLPVIWLPFQPFLFAHSTALHGTQQGFDPITDLFYPQYWTLN